ncbi:MAG: S9 family peptidase [Ilumatobacter sp.]|nr:S9 family peptidase [Ilumatobacter sp.]
MRSPTSRPDGGARGSRPVCAGLRRLGPVSDLDDRSGDGRTAGDGAPARDDAAHLDTFLRQQARTQRFTLGAPRNVEVSADGERVVFLRSAGGTDPVNSLWVLDVPTGVERIVGDPRALLGDTDHDLPAAERARRERTREAADGITSYATDPAGQVVAFPLAGRLFVAGLLTGLARPLAVAGPVFDPRPDPLARRIAYVSGRLLCIGELDGTWRVLAGDDPDESDTVSWGSADFIAAEEMHRFRGYWWSPDGTTIAACRVDTSPVAEWVIADPAHPERSATTLRYPAAGEANPEVSLHLLGLNGSRVDVEWDHEFFPYIASVDWTPRGLLMLVQSRDQRGTMTLRVDEITGESEVLAHDYDDAWVELVPGVPRLLEDGALLTAADRDGVRRLLVDDEPITPPELQVRAVVATGRGTITFQANPVDDATSIHVWQRHADGALVALTDEPGVHNAAVGGDTIVMRTATLDEPGTHTTTRAGHVIATSAQRPLVTPNIEFFTSEQHGLHAALLLPHDHDGTPLPVLLDPYGGPHGQRVTRAHDAYLTSQWFADQGFAVVVADGRGTPGRGSAWERAIHGDLATAPLTDQVEALECVAGGSASLDLSRVAIRGWSYGGYLAALAVLRRPDVFHAAIAGAPVTEWRLYDTHYTERYLGDPATQPEQYDASSLLPLAGALTRPLLLIHGLADDNVVAAHTLRLSSALLAAGRPHEVLPLVGVTHMTPQEDVAENLLLHQLDFLRRSLATPDASVGRPATATTTTASAMSS